MAGWPLLHLGDRYIEGLVQERLNIGRSCRRRSQDHAFMPHCTFSPHLLAQQGFRLAPEGEGALAGAI